jgi:hypothetical protein
MEDPMFSLIVPGPILLSQAQAWALGNQRSYFIHGLDDTTARAQEAASLGLLVVEAFIPGDQPEDAAKGIGERGVVIFGRLPG